MQAHIMQFFPYEKHEEPTKLQEEGLAFIGDHASSWPIVAELPTGTGKTALGIAYLRAMNQPKKVNFYLVPNKVQAEQVKRMYPEVEIMLGRSEHQCLYYPGEYVNAEEIPCSALKDCPHRVHQQNGETHTPGAIPCPYLKQRYDTKSAHTIVATVPFFLFAVFFGKQYDVGAVVIDEAHRLAKTIRGCLSHRLSNHKLERMITVLESFCFAAEAETLHRFLKAVRSMIVKNEKQQRFLVLGPSDIGKLLDILRTVDRRKIEEAMYAALKQGTLDPVADRELLKQFEVLARDLKRYISSLEYSLPSGDKRPLAYAFGYLDPEYEDGKKDFALVIKSYHVAGLIHHMFPERTLAYSATIGDPECFGIETGLRGAFTSLESGFSHEKTRIYMPTDTQDLAYDSRGNRDVARSLRLIVRSAAKFKEQGIRSLVILVSEDERKRFLRMCPESKLNGGVLDALSYGNGMTAREAAARFKEGEGDVLVGTVSQYGEGVDLPNRIAPVIFYLRPAYPNPYEPEAQFEADRYGARRFAVWNWRVMNDLMQVRGRNIRSVNDLGVTFLISQQFRKFARPTLPKWLLPAYVADKSMEECVSNALELLA